MGSKLTDLTRITAVDTGDLIYIARTVGDTGVSAAISKKSLESVFQPFDTDLASWAAVTRAAGFDTLVATPSSANLRSMLTDESGTGVALFAGTPGTNIANTPAGNIAATTVQAAIDELDTERVGGFRNILINGDGLINQRALATVGDDAYGHDRWNVLVQTAAVAPTTVSNAENGTPSMWRLTQSQAAAQRMGYSQIIEGVNCKHLRGKAVMLSGRYRCSASQAIRWAVLEWTGTEDAVTSDVVNDWTSSTYTGGNFFVAANINVLAVGSATPSAATLTDFTLAATVGSSANNLIVMIWTEGTAAQNVTLDGSLQFEVGAVATPREFRPYSVEFGLCLRYYFKATVFGAVGVVFGGGANVGRMTGPLPQRMRAAPTATLSGVGFFDGAATGTFSSISTSYNTVDTVQLDIALTAASLTDGRSAVAYNPGSASWAFSAEL